MSDRVRVIVNRLRRELEALYGSRLVRVVLYGVTIADGETIETICIPPELGRKLVHYLARRFSVPIQWFWNPLMIPGDEDRRRPS
jgi:hypothetical protein